MVGIDYAGAALDTTRTTPEAPNITNRDIWTQVKTDIKGKEVQTAETYSHSWLANQFGHICLGIILASTASVILNVLSVPYPWDITLGFAVASGAAVWWEWRAYKKVAAADATGQFPTGRKLLRANAIVAAAYMIVGAAIAIVYRCFALTPGHWLGLDRRLWAALCFVGLVIGSIRVALPWLRQKIVWQKAGLPYLFRLAEAPPTMDDDDVRNLLRLIHGDLPPSPIARPTPIVIGGPIGSGRTEFCAGIGTEFAFRDSTVRYMSFPTLLEFAARSQGSAFDDAGPPNIAYWRWSKAQVLIIDDIGPVLTPTAQRPDDQVAQFRQVLDEHLSSIRAVLAQRHTVWVIGDPSGNGTTAKSDSELDQFADHIRAFCTVQGQRPDVLVAQLDHGAREKTLKVPRVRCRYLR